MLTNIVLGITYSLLILYLSNKTLKFGLDENLGIQKIHKAKSFRLGGTAIFLGLLTVIIINPKIYINYTMPFFFIFIIFIIGLVEDITRRLSPSKRLLMMIFFSALLVFFTDTKLNEVDLKEINYLLKLPFVAFIITVLGISITSNAWNFIDGLNGLASGMAVVTLFSLSVIASQNNLIEVSNIMFSLGSIILGFFFINLYTGEIFLGDGGSYAIGSFIAWFGLKMVNLENLISAWSIFLVIIYPATEFSFSFIRRIILFPF